MLAIRAIVMKLPGRHQDLSFERILQLGRCRNWRMLGSRVGACISAPFPTPVKGGVGGFLGGLGAAGSALSAVLMLRLHSFNQPFTSFYRSKEFIIRPAESLDTCANLTSPGLLLHIEVFNWTLVFVPVWLHWNNSWLKSCHIHNFQLTFHLTDHDTSQ